MKEMLENSYLFSANAPFVEEQYAAYLKDPSSVSEDWQTFFRDLQARGEAPVIEQDHDEIRNEFKRLARQPRTQQQISDGMEGKSCLDNRQVSVLQLINAYRFRGHQSIIGSQPL